MCTGDDEHRVSAARQCHLYRPHDHWLAINDDKLFWLTHAAALPGSQDDGR
jgi:hypothetical protein